MSAATFDPEPIYYGDTWSGLLPFSIILDGVPPAEAVASAKVIFFRATPGEQKAPVVAQMLSSEGDDAAVEILDADDWRFQVPPLVLTLLPGEWSYHFKTTDASDEAIVRTWLVGTLTIR